ncbi:MAG: hypothetical protein HY927_00795 [Elusimicrobia bacterium]|nr:hypothetical protein [Elusimicrobiota bacterium]
MMKPKALACSMLAAALCSSCASVPDSLRGQRYAEPSGGPRLMVRCLRVKKALLSKDQYCLTGMTIDGRSVFRGSECKVKHGVDHPVIVSPGKHSVGLQLDPEWGREPGVEPERVSAEVEAEGQDLLLTVGPAGKVAVSSWTAAGAVEAKDAQGQPGVSP